MTQRAIDGPYIYFITTNVTYGRRWLCIPERAEHLGATIRSTCDEKNFDLFGYAILPNHVHLLVRKAGTSTTSQLMQSIKGRFSYSLWGGRFWKPRYNFRIIGDEVRFGRTLEYMTTNYVKHGLDEKFGRAPFVFIDWAAMQKALG